MGKSKEYTISIELIDYYQYNYPAIFQELYGSLLEKRHIDSKDVKAVITKLEELKKNPAEIDIFYKKQVSIIDRDIKESMKVIKKGHQKLLILTQIYLKTEWERVKVEAKTGSIAEFDFDKKFEIHKNEKENELLDLEK